MLAGQSPRNFSGQLIVPAPQNLTIDPHPGGWVLDWDTVTGATDYAVYRDGVQAATSNNTLEVVADPGTYFVTARIGTSESGPSNTVVAA